MTLGLGGTPGRLPGLVSLGQPFELTGAPELERVARGSPGYPPLWGTRRWKRRRMRKREIRRRPRGGLRRRRQPPLEVLPGCAEPLGATYAKDADVVNFALFSGNARNVTLCLYTEEDLRRAW